MKYDIKQLQTVQLSLLDELAKVCQKNNLRFYLAAGSCIGAVRHNGFIPWDDDIDVFMYAEDVDELFRHRDEFGKGFFLQNTETDPGYPSSIARLRKNGTTLVEQDEVEIPCHHGIFLDIYLLYFYPKGCFSRMLMVYRGLKRNILLANRPPLNHGKIVKAAGNVLLFFYRDDKRRDFETKKLTEKIRSFHDTDDLVILYGMDISLNRIISYKTKWFMEPAVASFEGRDVPVATDVDSYLKCRYGDDYMVLPPKEKRHSYHEFVCVSFTEEIGYNSK